MKNLLGCLLLAAVTTASAQWVQIGLEGRPVSVVAVANYQVFAVANDSSTGGVLRSTDGGVSWEVVFQPFALDVAVSKPSGMILVLHDTMLVEGEGEAERQWANCSIYRSTDNGSSWSDSRDSLGGEEGSRRLDVSPTGNFFLSAWHEGMLSGRYSLEISTDDGMSWRELHGGHQIAFHRQNVATIARGYDRHGDVAYFAFGISLDNGSNWYMPFSPGGPPYPHVTSLAWGVGGIVMSYYVGEDSQATVISKDTAKTWTPISIEKYTNLLSLPQGDILAATDSTGLRLFSADGDSIGPCNEGLTTLNILALELGDDGYVYAGTDDGIWRRAVSDLVTSVEQADEVVPNSYTLFQNYPNPFNPTTVISYQLPVASHVKLSVFDMLGREVRVLVDAKEEAGYHENRFDGASLASGVYLYRLTAGSFVQTRKMLVVK